jgi:transmembrane sensor
MSISPPKGPRPSPFSHALSAVHHQIQGWLGRFQQVDETPYGRALKVELTWLSPAQRSQLEALVPPPRTPLPKNVVEFSRYFPDRSPRQAAPEEPAPLQQQPRWHWPTAGVAALVMLALASLAVYALSPSPTDYVTGIGESRKINLEDGSILTMNTRSRVKVWYKHNQRDLQLVDGEALFSVAPDPNRPFRVHVGRTVVEAVGTEFVVRKDKHGTQVSVVEGRVKIFDSRSSAPLILNPNAVAWTEVGSADFQHPMTPVPVGAHEEARITEHGGASADFEVDRHEASPQDIERHLAWTNGQLIFENATLEETISEFNRYNRRQLQIGDPDIAQVHIGGAFRSTDIDDLVVELNSLFGIRAVATGDASAGTQVIQLKRERPGPP